MAVEIRILSGARQGQQFTVEGKEFRVGSDPSCEVFFDAARDAAIRGRSALVRQQGDGWYLHSASGGVRINQRPASGPTRLQPGDIVHMSDSGPDFSFNLAAAAGSPWWVAADGSAGASAPDSGAASAKTSATATGRLSAQGTTIEPRKSRAASPAAETQPAGAASATQRLSATATTVGAAAAGSKAAEGRQQTSSSGAGRAWLIGGAVALAIILIIVGLAKMGLLNPTIVVNVTPSGGPQPPSGNASTGGVPAAPGGEASSGVSAEKSNPPPPGDTGAEQRRQRPANGEQSPPPADAGADQGQQPSADRQPPPVRGAADLRAKLGEAVFLIEVEKSKHFWPFATCVAIGDTTLLTTAREAEQLATMRRDKRFKVWVCRQSKKWEVSDIRVNADYASLADKPGDWIYFDVGLLTVRQTLPGAATIASPAAAAKVKEGTPVTWFGFAHEGDKIAEEETFEPQMISGKVFLVTIGEGLPGRPRLLHVKAAIPTKYAFGGAVVNSEGAVVGLYGEAAAVPEGDAAAAALKNMHYVTPLNPAMIELGLRNPPGDIWLPAAPAKAAKPPKD